MSQVGECMFIIGLRKYLFKGMINLKRGLSRALKLDIYSFTLPASTGGNKNPIVDEDAFYHNKMPWVENFYESIKDNAGSVNLIDLPPSACLQRLTVKEDALI